MHDIRDTSPEASQYFRELAAQRALEDAQRPIPPLHHLGRLAGALMGEMKAIGEEIATDIRSHFQSFRKEVKRITCAAQFGLMAATYAYYRLEVMA